MICYRTESRWTSKYYLWKVSNALLSDQACEICSINYIGKSARWFCDEINHCQKIGLTDEVMHRKPGCHLYQNLLDSVTNQWRLFHWWGFPLWSRDCFIFIMGNSILVRRYLHNETAHRIRKTTLVGNKNISCFVWNHMWGSTGNTM